MSKNNRNGFRSPLHLKKSPGKNSPTREGAKNLQEKGRRRGRGQKTTSKKLADVGGKQKLKIPNTICSHQNLLGSNLNSET
jgi:hypothetical protein